MASMDTVYPGVLLGNVNAARDLQGLLSAGVTHVLNCAAANCPSFYPQHFTYKSMMLTDTPSQNIMQHFGDTSAFIREARNRGGAVFLHCIEGKSRSASCVIAFLMDTEGMTLQDALGMVQGARPIVRPNEGFLIQLQHYEGIARAGNGSRVGKGLGMSAASPAPMQAPPSGHAFSKQSHHGALHRAAHPHARHAGEPFHPPPLPRQHAPHITGHSQLPIPFSAPPHNGDLFHGNMDMYGHVSQYPPQIKHTEQRSGWRSPNEALSPNAQHSSTTSAVLSGPAPMGYRPAGSYAFSDVQSYVDPGPFDADDTTEHMSRYAAVYMQAQANAIQRAEAQRQEFQHFVEQDYPILPPGRRPAPAKSYSRPTNAGLQAAGAPTQDTRTPAPNRDEAMHVRLQAAGDDTDVDWSVLTKDSVFRQLMNGADDDDDETCGRVKKFVAGTAVVGKELTC